MAGLAIRIRNARRQPLDDTVDVEVSELPSGRIKGSRFRVPGSRTVTVSRLRPGEVYGVKVFPLRHRPVGRVVRAPNDGTREVDVFCPIHPLRARSAFPPFPGLPTALIEVLERSTLESDPTAPALPPAAGATSGERLFNGLDPEQKGGLLNLFTKMSNVAVGNADVVWTHVNDLYRIRGDRVFANVRLELRDLIKTEVAARRFEKVDGSLHTPSDGFRLDDSFKTTEISNAGLLQLTFFASTLPPLAFRVDADIDDAGGLGHVFQVLRNWLTDRDTHPYDIHQILVFHQELEPGYELSA